MAHENAGNYGAKHKTGTKLNPQIAEAVKKEVADGKIACAVAHKIARELGVSPADVGVTIDLLETRISKCQLGLYGYHPQKRIIKPAGSVSPSLEEAIKKSVENDRISCLSCWEIAKKSNIARIDVASACETLKVKISSCQLGAF